jgi:hypothetical protein
MVLALYLLKLFSVPGIKQNLHCIFTSREIATACRPYHLTSGNTNKISATSSNSLFKQHLAWIHTVCEYSKGMWWKCVAEVMHILDILYHLFCLKKYFGSWFPRPPRTEISSIRSGRDSFQNMFLSPKKTVENIQYIVLQFLLFSYFQFGIMEKDRNASDK